MTITWIPPFSRRVEDSVKIIPEPEVLDRCIAGLKKQARMEFDDDKRWKLKQIRKEIQLLRRQLA
jgi:hypothetical protein